MFLLSSKYIGYKQSYSYGKTTFIYIYPQKIKKYK